MQIQEYRPPHMRFEMRPMEDREASIKAGRKIYQNKPWVIVHPAGSKDEVERDWGDWVNSMQSTIERQTHDPEMSAFNQKVLDAALTGFERWKAGETMPAYGTPIRMCLMFTPAEQKAILDARILTLEELAEANEQALGGIGMGGRELKQRALTALKAATEGGKLAEENIALKAKVEGLEARLKSLEEALGRTGATIQAIGGEELPEPPKRRGRPPKAN